MNRKYHRSNPRRRPRPIPKAEIKVRPSQVTFESIACGDGVAAGLRGGEFGWRQTLLEQMTETSTKAEFEPTKLNTLETTLLDS